MGLDTVELVMEFEDAFAIAIPDEQAEQIQTLRDTVHFVVKTLQDQRPFNACRSAHRFYKLRTALQLDYGIARDRIRPDSESPC